MTEDQSELVEILAKEFDCEISTSVEVAKNINRYIRDHESSDLAEDMKDSSYIVRMLKEKPPDQLNLDGRWNWWIGYFSQESRKYKID